MSAPLLLFSVQYCLFGARIAIKQPSEKGNGGEADGKEYGIEILSVRLFNGVCDGKIQDTPTE